MYDESCFSSFIKWLSFLQDLHFSGVGLFVCLSHTHRPKEPLHQPQRDMTVALYNTRLWSLKWYRSLMTSGALSHRLTHGEVHMHLLAPGWSLISQLCVSPLLSIGIALRQRRRVLRVFPSVLAPNYRRNLVTHFQLLKGIPSLDSSLYHFVVGLYWWNINS